MSIERDIRINITGKDTSGTTNLLKLNKAIKAVAIGYAALKGAQKAVEFVKLGANAQAAEHRLVRFAGGAEEATKYLEALNRGSDNTIDRMTGMAQASRMLETHMASNAYEMEMAGAMVAKLGNQTWTTERRMQSLTMLLANQSIRRLDDFGMSVENVRRRQEALVAQGVSVEQAFKTAVFQEAEAALATLGDTSDLTATKLGQMDRVFKDIKISGAEAAAEIAAIYIQTQDLSSSGIEAWFENLAVQWENLHDYGIALQVGVDTLGDSFSLTLGPVGALINLLQGGPLAAEAFENALRQLAAAQIDWSHTSEISRYRQYDQSAATEEVVGTLIEEAAAMDRVGDVSQGYIRQLHMAVQSNDQLEATILSTISALQAESQALLDTSMSYSSYIGQIATSGVDYAGSMEEIEARYQKSIESIQGMGGGAAGSGAIAGRKFDRADIERGLRIQQAQLAEAEAGREAWGMGEKLEGLSWADIGREDRKWLQEHGKTLADLQAEHVKTGGEITELERAQTDDRIEDLKREIGETQELLERGHYEQHTIRVGAAQRDTTALLAEATARRDQEIAMLEESRAQQETINAQSLGRLELANFDSWVQRNIDTETATKAELDMIEQMRLDIALKYDLITADTITKTEAQWDAWDTLFDNIKDSADDAKDEVNELISAIQSLPAEAGQHWEDVIPIEVRQHGGSVLGGRPYLVGEEGPELIIPRQSGTVYNTHDTRRITDSHDTTTYNVTSDRAWQQLEEERRRRSRQAFTQSAGM